MARLQAALAPIDAYLGMREFLVGERFTIADAYLGLFAGLVEKLGGELLELAALRAFSARYERRPSVLAARAFEAQSEAA